MKNFIFKNIRTIPQVGCFVFALSPLWYNYDNALTATYIFCILTILISVFGLFAYPKKISYTIIIFLCNNRKADIIDLAISIVGITICLLVPTSDAMVRYVIFGIDIIAAPLSILFPNKIEITK